VPTNPKRVFDQVKKRSFTLLHARTLTNEGATTLLGIDVRTLETGTRATGCSMGASDLSY
jgi:hypothetical protein